MHTYEIVRLYTIQPNLSTVHSRGVHAQIRPRITQPYFTMFYRILTKVLKRFYSDFVIERSSKSMTKILEDIIVQVMLFLLYC